VISLKVWVVPIEVYLIITNLNDDVDQSLNLKHDPGILEAIITFKERRMKKCASQLQLFKLRL
jgi:hypothetical protein